MLINFNSRVSRQPFGGGLAALIDDMLYAFPPALAAVPALPAPAVMPKANAWEDGDGYVVELEVPGLSAEHVTVTLLDDTLTVEGSWERADERAGDVQRRERATGSFRRQFRFPAPVAPKQTTAAVKDGVLTVKVAKSPEAKAHKVKVKAG